MILAESKPLIRAFFIFIIYEIGNLVFYINLPHINKIGNKKIIRTRDTVMLHVLEMSQKLHS